MNILRAATDPSLPARRQQRLTSSRVAAIAIGSLFISGFTAVGVVHYREPPTSR